MKIHFEKYHGSGNDFVLINNQGPESIRLTAGEIKTLCNRHFGVGADGLIMIEPSASAPFEMKYYNADGNPGSMCGNGGRCAVMFCYRHGIIHSAHTRFMAYDGMHEAYITEAGSVKLSMASVNAFEMHDGTFFADTGSPHLVLFSEEIAEKDVVQEGRSIRNRARYANEGVNVNYVSRSGGQISMRTYERGVEDETLACGTGTVAVALACAVADQAMGNLQYAVSARGGMLKVYFNRDGPSSFQEVWLEGNAIFVFSGEAQI